MKLFEENYLAYRMKRVLDVLVKNKLSITDIGEVQKHFIDIKTDIRECFREKTEKEEQAVINRYYTAMQHLTKHNVLDD